MLKLEIEIAVGRLNSPAGDNATETLRAILARVPNAAPADLDLIGAMPSRFDQLASAAKNAGKTEEYLRFSAFRDAFPFADRAAPMGQGAKPAAPPNSFPSPATSTQTAAPSTGANNQGSSVEMQSRPSETGDGSGAAAPTGPAYGNVAGTGRAAIVANARDDAGSPSRVGAASPPPAASGVAGIAGGPVEPEQCKPLGEAQPRARVDIERASPPSLEVLVRRGNDSLALGDISAARLLFQRAAAACSASGAAGLAKTYDPVFLMGTDARGVKADAALATAWYRTAIALGDNEARSSLARLEQTLGNTEAAKAQPSASH